MAVTLSQLGQRLIGMGRGILLSPPPGHFYSPIVDKADMRRRASILFPEIPNRDVPGVDLNETGQLALLNAFERYYPEIPFTVQKQEKYRYFYENGFYCQSDGIFLYSIIRHFKP